MTPHRTFARALLGTVGRPTAEVLDEIGPGFTAADDLGLSGLQRLFQRRLAGRPGLRVVVRDAQGDRTTVLHDVPAVPGEALRTTLDPDVQQAADAALAGADTTAALLALRASTGEVLAVANGPDAPHPSPRSSSGNCDRASFTVTRRDGRCLDPRRHPPTPPRAVRASGRERC